MIQKLQEKDHLLTVFYRIGKITLATLDLDQILDSLTEQLVKTGLFRTIMIALVDSETHRVEITRCFKHGSGVGILGRVEGGTLSAYRPDDLSMAIEVERTGEMCVIEQLHDRDKQANGYVLHRQDKVFFYVPIKKESQVLAVLGTDGPLADKESMRQGIEAMGPLLDQVAIALVHEDARRKLQDTQSYLIQTDKMASLGKLATGIAHEINNPVGFVSSNLETLRDYLVPLKEILTLYGELEQAVQTADVSTQQATLKRLAEIRRRQDIGFILSDLEGLVQDSSRGMGRINEIVQSLKCFVRQDGLALEACSLQDCIEEALRILDNQLRYKCRVIKEFRPIPPVQGHPGQLKQVLVNLISNAAQAIPTRGEIRIATESTEAFAILRVSDTGSGIPADILPRIFDPFFTTKPRGTDTGLGLAISHKIIRAHNGHIEVESQEGKGTQFTVKVPWNSQAFLNVTEEVGSSSADSSC